MYDILNKKVLAENIIEYEILAPIVAKHAKAGQFIILIVDKMGERIPFTICDFDREKGSVTILVQTVGKSTKKLSEKKVGDSLYAFVGPLGNPTDLTKFKKIVLVGGGIGTAVIAPQARQLKSENIECSSIIGARTKDLVVYEDVFSENCEESFVCTDDGSYGFKGFVTQKLREILEEDDNGYDCVFAVGPLPMMRAVCSLTKEFNLPTIISMNSLMVDGTGMCGCCRLSVDGETKYACVDGPEFDGHKVDFEEAINRSKSFVEEEVCKIR